MSFIGHKNLSIGGCKCRLLN